MAYYLASRTLSAATSAVHWVERGPGHLPSTRFGGAPLDEKEGGSVPLRTPRSTLDLPGPVQDLRSAEGRF
jgi:hypothetical protein